MNERDTPSTSTVTFLSPAIAVEDPHPGDASCAGAAPPASKLGSVGAVSSGLGSLVVVAVVSPEASLSVEALSVEASVAVVSVEVAVIDGVGSGIRGVETVGVTSEVFTVAVVAGCVALGVFVAEGVPGVVAVALGLVVAWLSGAVVVGAVVGAPGETLPLPSEPEVQPVLTKQGVQSESRANVRRVCMSLQQGAIPA